MKRQASRSEEPSFVYLEGGPKSPQLPASKRKKTSSNKRVKDPVLMPLREGEKRAVELARFVTVKGALETRGIQITSQDFERLRSGAYLNDTLLDGFFTLLQARNRREVERTAPTPAEEEGVSEIVRPRVFVFGIYFYAVLTKKGRYNYEAVKRWFQKQGGVLSELDMIIVPINTGNSHWVLVVLDLSEKKVVFYDSLGGPGNKFVSNCVRWLQDEFANNGYNSTTDPGTWTRHINPANFPSQTDGTSCGVFIAFVADSIERGRLPEFSQRDTELLRRRALVYLVNGRM